MGTSGVLLIIGLVAAGIGAVLLFIGRRIQAKTNLLAKVPTVDASEVASLIPGEMIEVKGVIRCDTPLTAELAQRACVNGRHLGQQVGLGLDAPADEEE